MLKLKRAYDPPSADDGERILVERLWPRGLTRAKAGIDLWMKEVSPSPELRKWFAHDVAKWKEFRRRYRSELKEHKLQVVLLRKKAKAGTVTLVYAAKDEEHNSARVLKEYVEGK